MMIDKQIIEMAKQSHLEDWWNSGNEQYPEFIEHLQRFAQLVRNAALEQPAVEPVPLTTEEYTALAHRIASKYTHSSDPRRIEYTFLPHTLEQFVLAIEQAVRRKVGL